MVASARATRNVSLNVMLMNARCLKIVRHPPGLLDGIHRLESIKPIIYEPLVRGTGTVDVNFIRTKRGEAAWTITVSCELGTTSLSSPMMSVFSNARLKKTPRLQ